MKKILNILKNPWLIGITGFLAVVALIWYLGPLIAVAGQTPLATDLGRVVTIMTVGGAFALYRVIEYVSTLRRNRDMLAWQSTPRAPIFDTSDIQAELAH